MKKSCLLGLVILGLLTNAITPVTAKGVFSRIIITHEGREWIVDDPRALWFLSLGQLENFQEGGWQDAPEDAASGGYELERLYINPHDNSYQVFDRVRYYPNQYNGRGYIYVHALESDPAHYSDKWYPITPEGEASIQAVLAGDVVKCPVTQAREVAGIAAPAFGTNTLAITDIQVNQSDNEEANVTGVIYVHNSVMGEFTLGGTWLDRDEPVEFARAAWTKQSGRGEWVDHLTGKEIVPGENGYARYNWQAYFPAFGCYVLYIYANFQSVHIFIELN